jgi:hypothetical protein
MKVKESIEFSSKIFLEQLFEFYSSANCSTIVAVLPSYHHLKRAIFEFKKVEQFNEYFDLQYILTRVSAKNFYRHK